MAALPTILIICAIVIVAIILIKLSLRVVREKEVIVIERFGKYKMTLVAGWHFIIPFIDWPKKFREDYEITDARGNITRKNRVAYRVSTQNEVLDFPKQNVITRDNASIYLDAVISYKIINSVQMMYNVVNLPNVIGKLLQANLRNVAGTLDIDQIVEEAASLHILTGLMDSEASRWGVKVLFARVQRVEAKDLNKALECKKKAGLQNQEIIISAKGKKQTQIIESEGYRDSMIKKSEGTAQEIVANARGEARATFNRATAEARSFLEIARGIGKTADPISYSLRLKYIDVLKDICQTPNTSFSYLPRSTANLQTVQTLGMNTVVPSPSQFGIKPR